jgi:hypothetical protein
MRPSLPARDWGECGAVISGEAMTMQTPGPTTGKGTDQEPEICTIKLMDRAGHETETCLDSFLGVLEYLSEATGLSIEDIADLLSSKEGPMGAMVLAGHLQATIRPEP